MPEQLNSFLQVTLCGSRNGPAEKIRKPHHETRRKGTWALMLCAGLLLSACKTSTQVTGTVTDQTGRALGGATVMLGYSELLKSTAQSNARGQYIVTLEEKCFILCAGGNPSLSVTLDGYSSSEIFVHQFDANTYNFVLTQSGAANVDTDEKHLLDAELCTRHGGTINADSNSENSCSFGPVLAVFDCAKPNGHEKVDVIARSEQEILIRRSASIYETLAYSPSGSGEKYVGQNLTFWEKGKEAVLMTANVQTYCRILQD